MTRIEAELVAHALGVTVAQDALRCICLDPTAPIPDNPPITDEMAQARIKLGQQRFSYLVLQGAQDVLEPTK